jgi:hypothetical protein
MLSWKSVQLTKGKTGSDNSKFHPKKFTFCLHIIDSRGFALFSAWFYLPQVNNLIDEVFPFKSLMSLADR